MDPKYIEQYDYIQKLYELVHPYSKFNYDYVQACISLRREIKKLCRPENKPLILVLTRAMSPQNIPDPKDGVKELCGKLFQQFTSNCLSIDLISSSKIAMNYGLGVIPSSDTYTGSEICKSLINGLNNVEIEDLSVVEYFYGVSSEFGEITGLFEDKVWINVKGENRLDIVYRVIKSLEKGDNTHRHTFQQWLDFDPTFDLSDFITFYGFLGDILEMQGMEVGLATDAYDSLTSVDRNFIKYIHEGFRTGQLKYSVKWKDLCSQDYIKAFNM